MFAAGEDFDLTFGLMHTAEKSAEILVKMLSMRPDKLQTITPDNFRHLAKDFNVTLPEEFFNMKNNTIVSIEKQKELQKGYDFSYMIKYGII